MTVDPQHSPQPSIDDEEIDIAKEAEATLTRLYGPLDDDDDSDGP